jgi:hypothetical protein
MYRDLKDPRLLESRRKHYRNNKTQYYERNDKKRASLKHFLAAVKSYPCLDCGVSYPPWVMQFDHLPGTEKLFTPAMLSSTTSWRRTIEEILKCEEVCANCHAQRTHDRKEQLHMG